MRHAKVFYQDILAGILTETNDGDYFFQYQDSYVQAHPDDFITFSMPVSSFQCREKRLFPFF